MRGHTLDHWIALMALRAGANGSMTLRRALGARGADLGKLTRILAQTHVAGLALNAVVVRLAWFGCFRCTRRFYLL